MGAGGWRWTPTPRRSTCADPTIQGFLPARRRRCPRARVLPSTDTERLEAAATGRRPAADPLGRGPVPAKPSDRPGALTARCPAGPIRIGCADGRLHGGLLVLGPAGTRGRTAGPRTGVRPGSGLRLGDHPAVDPPPFALVAWVCSSTRCGAGRWACGRCASWPPTLWSSPLGAFWRGRSSGSVGVVRLACAWPIRSRLSRHPARAGPRTGPHRRGLQFVVTAALFPLAGVSSSAMKTRTCDSDDGHLDLFRRSQRAAGDCSTAAPSCWVALTGVGLLALGGAADRSCRYWNRTATGCSPSTTSSSFADPAAARPDPRSRRRGAGLEPSGLPPAGARDEQRDVDALLGQARPSWCRSTSPTPRLAAESPPRPARPRWPWSRT